MNKILHQNGAAFYAINQSIHQTVDRRARVTQQLDLNRQWRLHTLTPAARLPDRSAPKAALPDSKPS